MLAPSGGVALLSGVLVAGAGVAPAAGAAASGLTERVATGAPPPLDEHAQIEPASSMRSGQDESDMEGSDGFMGSGTRTHSSPA